jgi:hypothetical protein
MKFSGLIFTVQPFLHFKCKPEECTNAIGYQMGIEQEVEGTRYKSAKVNPSYHKLSTMKRQ